MSNAVPLHEDEGRVQVAPDEVRFKDFVDRDREVVHVFNDTDDPVTTAHICLQIGARAIQATQAATDTGLVARAFADMNHEFERQLEETLRRLNNTTDGLLAEDGEISKALGTWRADVASMLGDTFNPDSKKSVISQMERIMEASADAQRRAIRALIDPHNDDSPLNGWRRDIVSTINTQQQVLLKAITDVSEKIAVEQKAAEIYDLTTHKGRTYEQLVHDGISALSSSYGDAAEVTTNVPGYDGNNKGDEVVTLNVEDTNGVTARFVLEMKDQSLSHPKAMRELDAAMENRAANAGIIVFAKQTQAPMAVPFSYVDNRAIVVIDKQDPDPHLLRLAYLWARWVTRRSFVDETPGNVDRDKIHGLIDRILTSMSRVKTIKGSHTSAAKCITQAGEHLRSLEAELSDALDELRNEVGA